MIPRKTGTSYSTRTATRECHFRLPLHLVLALFTLWAPQCHPAVHAGAAALPLMEAAESAFHWSILQPHRSMCRRGQSSRERATDSPFVFCLIFCLITCLALQGGDRLVGAAAYHAAT